MSEGSDIETYSEHGSFASPVPAWSEDAPVARDATLRNVLLFVALAAASAGIAYAVVRATLLRVPADPTTERIQQLIDEANRLLAQLDDKKSDA